MTGLQLDHSFYSDPNFESWYFLKNCLPDELFPHKEVKHPDSLCRFIALENFILEFSHVTDGKSYFQGLSFLTESSVFDLEEQIPSQIKDKYGVVATHKNRDWEKDIDKNGELPILKKEDPRIRAGWGSLSPEIGSIHPDLYLWVGQFVLTKDEKPIPKKTWGFGKFKLKKVHLNATVLSNPFFQLLTKNTSDVVFLRSHSTLKPIEKMTIEVCEEYFRLLELPENENIKILKSRDYKQYDLEFILC